MEEETKFECPVAECAFVGTPFEINMHLQSGGDEDHIRLNHQLETTMNDAYEAAEWNWVLENCEEAKKEEK